MLETATATSEMMVDWSSEVHEKARKLVQPTRFHMLVRMFRIPAKTATGIILTQKTQAEETISGTRVQVWVMGRDCFKGKEWPSENAVGIKEGDWCLVQSYAGGQIKIEEWPDEEFKIINDTELLCRIADPEKVNRKW